MRTNSSLFNMAGWHRTSAAALLFSLAMSCMDLEGFHKGLVTDGGSSGLGLGQSALGSGGGESLLPADNNGGTQWVPSGGTTGTPSPGGSTGGRPAVPISQTQSGAGKGGHGYGGTAATSHSGTSVTYPNCAGKNLLLATQAPDYRWIGGDENTKADDPCGIQGTIFAFTDSVPSATWPNPTVSTPCTSDHRCCIRGATKLWSGTVGQREWGAGIGINLNQRPSSSTLLGYDGPAIGFEFRTTGYLAGGHEVRVNLVHEPDTIGPYESFPAGTGLGTLTTRFDEAWCPDWAPICSSSGTVITVQVMVVGGDYAGAFELCIESMVAILK